MSVKGVLLRIARAVVRSIIQTIAQQVRILQDAITNPMKAIVQMVLSGVWKGDGATRFVEEISSDVVPALVSIGNVTSSLGMTVSKAIDIMDQAEVKATKQAQQLYDVFNNIYR
jgi:hypothetical protein